MKHLYLQIRRFILSLFTEGKDEPTHLKEVEVEWTCGHQWGNYHPDHLFQWWHQGDVDPIIQGDKIGYVYDPRVIRTSRKVLTMDYRKGVRRSTTLFTRGFFHFEVDREPVEGTKDAIWLTRHDYWPQEVDIVEMYGDEHRSNFHVKEDLSLGWGRENHKIVGSKRHTPAKTYSCWIEKDFIRIYYDGFLVREFTDMKYYTEGEYEIIINTSCIKPVPHEMTVKCKVYL